MEFFEVVYKNYKNAKKDLLTVYSPKDIKKHEEFVDTLYKFCKTVLKKFSYHELTRLKVSYFVNDGGWYGFDRKSLKKIAEAYKIVTWFTISRAHFLDSETADKKIFSLTKVDILYFKKAKTLQKFFEKL